MASIIEIDARKGFKTDKEYADFLRRLDNRIWEQLNLSSGSELKSNLQKQKSYLAVWKDAKKTLKLKKVNIKVQDILEDGNFHSANMALSIVGLGTKQHNPKYWDGWEKQSSGWYLHKSEIN